MSHRERLLSRIFSTVMFAGLAVAARGQVITEYAIPPGNGGGMIGPAYITSGPDGALWFTKMTAGTIGRVTTSGSFSEVALPAPTRLPNEIVTGPDGNLWFTEGFNNMIGRMTPAGTLTEFSFTGAFTGDDQNNGGITVGQDGHLWFTANVDGLIGKITTSGTIEFYVVPHGNVNDREVVTGPDGNLWFTEFDSNLIGRMTTGGVFTEYPIPTPKAQPFGITSGPDGALWFTESGAHRIGSITTGGTITEYVVPDIGSAPWAIVAAPDGALYFTDSGNSKIGKITTAGVITTTATPTPLSVPMGMTVGPDANIWFVESAVSKIGTFSVGGAGGGPCIPSSTVLCIDDQPGDRRFKIEVTYQTSQGGGQAGDGKAIPLSSLGVVQGGLFWFSTSTNPELLLKVLNACSFSSHYWFFGSAGTNQGVTIKVTDTKTGVVQMYVNPDLHPMDPIQDTSAFACQQ